MSWSKLFKPKPKSDPRVRWFGKLPTYPDYYSSPADEDWAIEFNDWILKGFEVYQSRRVGTPTHGRRLPVAGCAVRLPKSQMTVFASILDYGGDMRGRPFPMCFYAAVPTAQWPGPTSDRLHGACRVLSDLFALRREVGRFLNSPGRLESAFGDRQIDLAGVDTDSRDASWVGGGQRLSLDAWFAEAREGIKTQQVDAWVRAAGQWGQQLASCDSKELEPTIRFPLAMRLPLHVQVAGWVRWLENRLDMRRRQLSLAVCGEPDNGTGQLTLIAREVLAEDFLLLTPLANTLPYLDDLCGLEPGAGGDAEGDEAAAPFASPSCWLDFVNGQPKAA